MYREFHYERGGAFSWPTFAFSITHYADLQSLLVMASGVMHLLIALSDQWFAKLHLTVRTLAR